MLKEKLCSLLIEGWHLHLIIGTGWLSGQGDEEEEGEEEEDGKKSISVL